MNNSGIPVAGSENNKERPVLGYLSGTFDLFHIGHLNLISRASGMCDYLIVGNTNPISAEYETVTDEKGFLISRRIDQ